MNTMADVTQPKSDQINADDLIGGPMTVTITGVKIKAGEDQPISMSLANSAKVYRPCKSMARVFMSAWGADATAYIGRSLTLYRDPKVKWGGLEVGGIRISHMTDIEKDMVLMLTQTRANRAPHKIKPLQLQQQPPATVTAPPQENAIALCEVAAKKGTDYFREWWNSDEGKACRVVAKENLERLQGIAAAVNPPPPVQDDESPPI